MANIPDFNYKPDNGIIQAFQQAAAQRQQAEAQQKQLELQKRKQDFDMVKDTASAVSGMVSSFVQAAERRKTNQIVEQAKGILANPEPSDTIQPSGALKSFANPVKDEIMTQREKARLDLANALNAPALGKEMAEAAVLEAQNKDSVGRGFQQSGIQITDKNGQVKTVPVSYDTATGTYIHPITKQPITNMNQLQDLPDRGYAQGFRAAGYTQDGREIVAEQRTGKKYVVGEDGDYQEYGGQVFSRKENLPAALTDSLGELEYSQQVLGRIAESFNPEFVGPIAAKAGKMSQYIEALTDDQRVQFYGNIAEYKNSIIKAITGAQMSEVEAKRIMQQIPNENTSPAAFKTALQRAWRATNERVQARVKAAEQGGYAYRGTPMSAEQAEKLLNEKFSKYQESTPKQQSTNNAQGIDAIANVLGLKKKGN